MSRVGEAFVSRRLETPQFGDPPARRQILRAGRTREAVEIYIQNGNAIRLRILPGDHKCPGSRISTPQSRQEVEIKALTDETLEIRDHDVDKLAARGSIECKRAREHFATIRLQNGSQQSEEPYLRG